MRTNTITRKTLLAFVLTIAGLVAGQSAWATGDFTVSNPSGSTFRITRSGNTSIAETVHYRTVSLTALEGQHFNGVYQGTAEFQANSSSVAITITEKTPANAAFTYQNGTNRSYRFEVYDKNGDILAYCDHIMTTGTSITSSDFAVKSIPIDNHNTNEDYIITVTDKNYSQGYHSFPVTVPCTLFPTAAHKNYLRLAGAELLMQLEFLAAEVNDGYQHVQILVNQPSNHDEGASGNNPGTLNYARYLATFVHQAGSYCQWYGRYTFPVTSAGSNCGELSQPWYGNPYGDLRQQLFNTGCRANDGRLIICKNTNLDTFTHLGVRFDASGDNEDTWLCKNAEANIQAVDKVAPTVIDHLITVSGGTRQRGNTWYVSVPFSEIVKVTGTLTLNTSWGTLTYLTGSGTNVLTFKGTINNDASGILTVLGYSSSTATIADLSSNLFSGSIYKEFTLYLTSTYHWTGSDFNTLNDGSYEIASKLDLRHLALMVNSGDDACNGKTFSQTRNIVCDNTYTPIGKYGHSFKGTYNGLKHRVSGIIVNRANIQSESASEIGLFGYIESGTVENVVVSNSRFTGIRCVAGIAGKMTGGSTIRNCLVANDVYIASGSNSATDHGGIVGVFNTSTDKVEGCLSAANIQSDGNFTSCNYHGGIVGRLYEGTLKNSLFTGPTPEGNGDVASLVGWMNSGTFITRNNYYTVSSLGGTFFSNWNDTATDRNGLRHAHTVALGTDISLIGDQTVYDLTGLTAIGDGALKYDDGNAVTYYSGQGQTLTLQYSGLVPDHYNFAFVYNDGSDHVIVGNSFTMPDADVTVSVKFIAEDWETLATGEIDDPYMIHTTEQLDTLAQRVRKGNTYENKYFKLGADITYSTEGLGETDSNYTPIGDLNDEEDPQYFKGHFDGDGHRISGIRIYTGKGFRHCAVFGRLQNATVENMIVSNCTFTNRAVAGGIAGVCASSTIRNCQVESDVTLIAITGGTNSHGGIAGYVYGTTTVYSQIIGCVSGARITNNSFTNCKYRGGIVGYMENFYVRIKDCLSTESEIVATDYVGRLIGKKEAGSALFFNNYYIHNGTTQAIGEEGLESHDDLGLRPALTVTLKPGIRISGSQTAYDVSGLTSIGNDPACEYNGNTLLRYNDGNTVTYYSGVQEKIVLDGDGDYVITKASNGTDITADVLSGNTVTMPGYDIVIGFRQASLSATATTIFGESKYVTTFYSSVADYELETGAKAYTASLDGDKVVFHLVGDDGSVIPQGTAVIVVSDAANASFSALASTTVTPHAGNILQGSDTDVNVSGLSGTPYVLNISGGNLGFYKFTGSTLPAGKAYYLKNE